MLSNSKNNIPHLLIYGPAGSGKKTRAMAILRSIYGNAVEKIKLEKMAFTLPSSKKLEIDVVSSNYHFEVNPSDAGNSDRHVVQEMIKKLASTPSVATTVSKKNNITFKTILITEADRLSKDAQHALRRTMEKYMSKCRCILITKSISRVIAPLRSRCLPIKCRAATSEELEELVLRPVMDSEFYGKSAPSNETVEKILKHSNRDMRKCLLLLEVYKVHSEASISSMGDIEEGVDIEKYIPDWEIFTKKLISEIQKVNNVQEIMSIRTKLYELIVHLIPTEIIFKTILQGLIDGSPMILRQATINAAAKFEHRSRLGDKEIYHLEGFVVEYLAMKKEYENTGKCDLITV